MSRFLTGAVIVLVAIAVLLFAKHDSDTRRDGRIVILDSLRRQDSIARVGAERALDSARKAVHTASIRLTQVDTLWRTTTHSVTNVVEKIVHDTVMTAEEKVPLLVTQITRLQAVGDSLSRAGRLLQSELATDSMARDNEHALAAKERLAASQEIALLKKQSRHWGLGGSLGYGAMKVGPRVYSGPVLNLGLVYRF
jgi:hypothetical protein